MSPIATAVWPWVVGSGLTMLLGGVGWLVREAFRRQESAAKEKRDRESAAEAERRKNDPTLHQIVADQTKDLFARYEERIKALEARDLEREQQLTKLAGEVTRAHGERDQAVALATNETKRANAAEAERDELKGKIVELEGRIAALEEELGNHRSPAARTRHTDSQSTEV